MEIQNGKGKALVGVLSAVLVAIGGYSADTVATLVKSNYELSAKVAKLELEMEFVLVELGKGERFIWKNGADLMKRMEGLESRINGMIPNQVN